MDQLILLLKQVLATTFSSYLKAQFFHWNVEGEHFVSLHQLFGAIYEDTWKSIDDIAEQIRQLDAYTPGALDRFIELSQIETTNDVARPREMLIALMNDQETLMRVMTEALHAAAAEDRQGLMNFLAGRLEVHSKYRWQLRATAKQINEQSSRG
jgi:starvation-inducible DNA-binding protein